jgi:hypothetical protein
MYRDFLTILYNKESLVENAELSAACRRRQEKLTIGLSLSSLHRDLQQAARTGRERSFGPS